MLNRRLRRKTLFVATSAVTALLLVLCIRSFWFASGGVWRFKPSTGEGVQREVSVRASRGRLEVGYSRAPRNLDLGQPGVDLSDSPVSVWEATRFKWQTSYLESRQQGSWGSFTRYEFLGFGFISAYESDRQILSKKWKIPLAPILLITAVFPTVFLAKQRQHRIRLRKGLCTSCGYDLRSSPDRCPECGALLGSGKTPGLSLGQSSILET